LKFGLLIATIIMLHRMKLVVLLGALLHIGCESAPLASEPDNLVFHAGPSDEGTPLFVLAGDSTTAVNGGWGDGFIHTLRESNRGQNLGQSGATTVSFRNSGNWDRVMRPVHSVSSLQERDAKANKAFFVLAGDSTTAKQSDGGGGWGDGFLRSLQPPSGGTNLGHNGATTVSYRSGGDWGKVVAEAKKNGGAAYVTIQVRTHPNVLDFFCPVVLR
jgi:hypothetical protein